MGEGFNARLEIEALIVQVAANREWTEELKSLIDMHASTKLAAVRGFSAARLKWTRGSAAEMYLYIAPTIIAGLHVPGDARVETLDVTFLGVLFESEGVNFEESYADTLAFETKMSARRKSGREVIWS